MGFWNKLFSKKKSGGNEENLSDKEKDAKKSSTEIEKKETSKNYNIGHIKKKSTQIKNEKGFLDSIEFIFDFIDSNPILFPELISLLKKVLPYMKKEVTISEQDIFDRLSKYIGKFRERNQIEGQLEIAKIFGKISPIQGQKYLEDILGSIDSDTQKNASHFDLFLELSGDQVLNKLPDEAFQSLRRARLLIPPDHNNFDLLMKEIEISTLSEKICQISPNNKAIDILYFKILSFLFEIGKDLLAFPSLSGFFYRKKICFDQEWGWFQNSDFPKYAHSAGFSNEKKSDLIKMVNEFAFNTLPIEMGIEKPLIENLEKCYIEKSQIDFSDQILISASDHFSKSKLKIEMFEQSTSAIIKQFST